MKVITNLCKADNGEVKIFGYDVFNQFEKAIQKVGCIIESVDSYEYILPLLIASVAVDTFSCEFGDKTLKIILLRPISRFKVFTSKIICIGTYIIVNLFIVFIVSSILGFIIVMAG